jgi:SAM-dependent methyltransferase
VLDFLAALNRPIRAEDLVRLRREREEADRAYREALSAVDRTVQHPPPLPHPPPAPDETRFDDLQRSWALLPQQEPAFESGWRGMVQRAAWTLVSPMLGRQQAFNAALADHLARNVGQQREVTKSIETTITLIGEQLVALEWFELHAMHFLQTLTLAIDSKDRECAGFAEHRALGLAAGLAGLADELQKRWESMATRELRLEANLASLADAHRAAASELGGLHRVSATLKRELERLAATGVAGSAAPAASSTGAAPPPVHATIDAYKYVGFEDRFRGAPEEIRERLADYLPQFEGAQEVLDVGCGRGEFLDLLRERGVAARGLDLNHEMVEICRARGLDVVEADALAYVSAQPDESIGGLLAAQVVEHLQPDYLIRLLDTAFHKLRPGAAIVLETINPACWVAFFESYIRDLTHVRPVHPDTLRYLLTASGFHPVDIQFRMPYPERDKLQRVPVPPVEAGASADTHAIAAMAETFNGNVDRINRLLFTWLDYAAIGRKPAAG